MAGLPETESHIPMSRLIKTWEIILSTKATLRNRKAYFSFG
jgi:hypothetical protein